MNDTPLGPPAWRSRPEGFGGGLEVPGGLEISRHRKKFGLSRGGFAVEEDA